MTGHNGLRGRGFVSLLFIQAMGAVNDNILKQFLTFMVATGGVWAAGGLGEGGQSVVALCLAVPFIVLSGFAGQYADRYSKQRVIFWVKVAEVPIAFLAFAGTLLGNLWVTLFALVLLSVQSVFFGPAKYGVIPELVDEDDLSRANGLINMLTNIAIIAGSFAAGPLSDLYWPTEESIVKVPEPVLWAPGAALVLVALLGLAGTRFMPSLEPANPQLPIRMDLFSSHRQTFKDISRPLLTVMFSWSGFYLIAALALLILPEYKNILEISYLKASLLVAMLGVSIGIGSGMVGLVSGKHIRPTFIPVGAIGMGACFTLLGLLTPTFFNVALLIFCIGFFAGFYIVPLQALLQYLSPEDERGRFFGTANALSFCFISLASGLYWVLVNRLQMPPNRVHLVCAGLAIVGTAIGIVQMRRVMPRHGESQIVVS